MVVAEGIYIGILNIIDTYSDFKCALLNYRGAAPLTLTLTYGEKGQRSGQGPRLCLSPIIHKLPVSILMEALQALNNPVSEFTPSSL